ncbi:hypothetical protein GCM10020220_114440 [Nonomuraea rubra]
MVTPMRAPAFPAAAEAEASWSTVFVLEPQAVMVAASAMADTTPPIRPNLMSIPFHGVAADAGRGGCR